MRTNFTMTKSERVSGVVHSKCGFKNKIVCNTHRHKDAASKSYPFRHIVILRLYFFFFAFPSQFIGRNRRLDFFLALRHKICEIFLSSVVTGFLCLIVCHANGLLHIDPFFEFVNIHCHFFGSRMCSCVCACRMLELLFIRPLPAVVRLYIMNIPAQNESKPSQYHKIAHRPDHSRNIEPISLHYANFFVRCAHLLP